MDIIPLYYRSFDFTKDLYRHQKTVWKETRGYLQVAKAIAKIFLSTLLLYPIAFVLDLICTPIRYCYPRRDDPIGLHMPPSPYRAAAQPPLRPRTAQEGRVPGSDLIERVLADPYPGAPHLSNIEFFKDSLRAAFRHNNSQTVTLYKQMIENDGILEGRDEPPINIYQWGAGCLIAYHCVVKNHFNSVDHLYQESHPGVVELYRTLQRINTQEEKAAALLQIMVPSVQWQLSVEAKRLVNEINGSALTMTQDPNFFQQIYDPVSREIANFN